MPRREPGAIRGLSMAAGRRVLAAVRGVADNYRVAWSVLGLAPLLLTAPALIAALGLGGAVRTTSWRLDRVGPPVGALLIAGAVAANELVLARVFRPGAAFAPYSIWSVRMAEVVLAIGGAALIAGSAALRRFLRPLPDWVAMGASLKPLALCLAAPWLALIVLVEHGRPERLFFLWPVQVVLLSGVLTAGVARVAALTRVWHVGRAVLVAGLLVVSVGRVANGFEFNADGTHSAPLQMIDTLAGMARASDRREAAIGFETVPPNAWDSRFRMTDPHYKVGAEYDLMLQYRHRIANLNHCPGGVGPRDDFRVVQAGARRPLMNGELDHLVKTTTVGDFDLYVRTP